MRIALELRAQVTNVDPQLLDVFGRVTAPDLLKELAVGHQLAAVIRQGGEEVELGRGQMDLLPVSGYAVIGKVDLYLTENQPG